MSKPPPRGATAGPQVALGAGFLRRKALNSLSDVQAPIVGKDSQRKSFPRPAIDKPTSAPYCQCGDMQKGKKEFAVFLFKHEYNYFEPYTENFAACIKRLAGERL